MGDLQTLCLTVKASIYLTIRFKPTKLNCKNRTFCNIIRNY